MENLKNYWWICLITIILIFIGYFAYKNKDDIKLMFLVKKQIIQAEKAKANIEKLEKRIEEIQQRAEEFAKKL